VATSALSDPSLDREPSLVDSPQLDTSWLRSSTASISIPSGLSSV